MNPTYRMSKEEAIATFGGLEKARQGHRFIQDAADSTKDFSYVQDGPFRCGYKLHGIAGIFHLYGPFPPATESVVALEAEGFRVQYFLEFTYEAGSWFLAWNLTEKPLVSLQNLERASRAICAGLRRELGKHYKAAHGGIRHARTGVISVSE